MVRTRIGALGVAVTTCAVLTVGASPAFAKWSVHNSNDVTQMTAPSGGTEDQTCSDRLVGQTGWSVFVSPDEPAPDPLPSGAFTGVTYELWKTPAGFSNMNEAVEEFDGNGNFVGYTFFDLNGNPFPATQVKLFTTAQRTALAQPIPINGGPPTGDVYVFTAADFDEALSGVAPGDFLGLKPTGGATFLNLAAVDCSTTSGYTFDGFFAPVDNPPIVNVGRAGFTYPVKFSLTDASGTPISDLSAIDDVQVQRKRCAAICNLPTDRLEMSVTGGTSLRYDAATGRFVYKWKTPARGCYKLTVVLADGQSFPALFRLRESFLRAGAGTTPASCQRLVPWVGGDSPRARLAWDLTHLAYNTAAPRCRRGHYTQVTRDVRNGVLPAVWRGCPEPLTGVVGDRKC